MRFPGDIPKEVLDELRTHVIGTCEQAQSGYRSGRGREDAVTGALGERLRLEPFKYVKLQEGTWKFAVHWSKFRSASGRSGEEREIGADGIVQFEVYRAYGEEVYTKGLLFQAKKDDDNQVDRLFGQCELMEDLVSGGGALFEYSEETYSAMDSRTALRYQQTRAATRPDFRSDGLPLGTYLTDRFLACEVGSESLYYDIESETLFVPNPNGAFQRIRARLDKITIEVYSPVAVSDAVRPRSRR
jgi:hypothetical protein